LKATDIYR